MKPAPFDYHAPTTVDEATGLLGALGDQAKVLAGGQSLVPMLNLRLTRFEALVDVRRIASLQRMERTDGEVTLGAMVRQCDIEESPEIAGAVPLLAAATPLIGHFQIRSRGTVGGSIAHADPAAEYPAVAVALDAELEIARAGSTRRVPAADFFVGMWTPALEADELLVASRFPIWGAGSGFAVEEVARRHGDFAIAGACVGVRVAGGSIDKAAIALFGMGSTPLRAVTAEKTLVGIQTADVDAVEVGRLAVVDLAPPEDLHASAELRRRIGATVVARAVGRAIEEAEGA
ncbi:MAG: FAD binding domain-containing protein [Acidimicrobiales bacterium]